MYCSLKAGFSISVSRDTIIKNRGKGSISSIGTLQFKESKSREYSGITLNFSDHKSVSNLTVNAQASFVNKSPKWWEKSLQPNMIEIDSAQEFAESLLNAGDKLVVVDFYSPGCGGCKALHPKICQLAELNPNVTFLMVNYEQHKAMCYALRVHVLPFFRFYRGAEGKVCSFSCTNATINKFKVALAKHETDRCSIGPTKGLEESELLALASIDLISKDLIPIPTKKDEVEVLVEPDFSNAFTQNENKIGLREDNAVLMS